MLDFLYAVKYNESYLNETERKMKGHFSDLFSELLYRECDPREQGQWFIRHMSAMTTEHLHDKGDIAMALADRDIEIDRLNQRIEELLENDSDY